MTKIVSPNFIKKQPIALGCALLCVALVVAIYLRRGTLAEANDVLVQKKMEGEHLSENVTSGSKLDEQLAAMTQATQAIEARLVHADQLAVNLQYFYKLESETQTKLSDLRQTGAVAINTKNGEKSAYVGVGYVIVVNGTYPQLLDFLRRVENGDRFSRVLSLTLSGGGSGENTPGKAQSLSLNLNFELLGLP